MRKRVEGSVAEVLQRLSKGDYVTTTWVDASQSKHVNVHRLPLPNHNVETRKDTSGRFVCVQKGGRYRDPYLIILFEKTDDIGEIVSIPLSLVKRIAYASVKEPLKNSQAKRVQRFKDGSVKRLW